MSNLIDKLKTPSNSLIARLIGSSYVPKTTLIPPEPEELNIGLPLDEFDKQVDETNDEPEDVVMGVIDQMPGVSNKEAAKARAKERRGLVQKLGDKIKEENVINVNITPKQQAKNRPAFVSEIKQALAKRESDEFVGNEKYTSYQFSGYKPLGEAMGKYRITEGLLHDFDKEFFNRTISTEEFLNTPEIQEDFMTKWINKMIKKGNPIRAIANMHREGMYTKNYNEKYVNAFIKDLEEIKEETNKSGKIK